MRHQAQVPAAVAAYFGISRHPGYGDHPTVGQVFRPGRGWVHYPGRKRISGAYVRKARADGITHIAVDWHGRRADFRIEELTRGL